MYGEGNIFTQPNAVNGSLKGADVVEQAKMLNAGRIASQNKVSAPSTKGVGVSLNNSIYSVPGANTNDYLIDQKLRNNGLYSKLKNKTIYSAGSLAHASLNSGIL